MENAFTMAIDRYPRAGRLALAGGLVLLATAMFARPAAAVVRRPPPIQGNCGDGVIENGEECDTNDFGVATCLSLGFAGGSLACTGACTFDTTLCTSIVKPRFTDNLDNTVTDNLTGLMWEKKDASDGVMNYSDPHDVDNVYTYGGLPGCTYFMGCPNGNAFTEFLGLMNHNSSTDGSAVTSTGYRGHHDWRLPTIQELDTIVLPTCQSGGPCIDPIFGPTVGLYWSSTTLNLVNQDDAWVESFTPLLPKGWIAKTYSKGVHVRAVRNAD
jgi:hypothetical protein